MSELISFGAGVNSVAMTIMLVNDGWEGPIVFADPGAEYPETYCYMDMFEREWLEPRGLAIIRLSPATHPQLYSPAYRLPLEAKCLHDKIVPLLAARWCTDHYKITPVARRGKNYDIHLIGFSLEEKDRAERAERKKPVGYKSAYPLIERKIDRHGCKNIIRNTGLPIPRKSGCFFCPLQRKSEWRLLYDRHPNLFQRAVDLANGARERDPRRPAVQLGLSLSLPLHIARDGWQRQIPLDMTPAR